MSETPFAEKDVLWRWEPDDSTNTALGEAAREGYVPWACVPTGEVIEVTQERARELFEEGASA